jgi:hypothetical protein
LLLSLSSISSVKLVSKFALFTNFNLYRYTVVQQPGVQMATVATVATVVVAPATPVKLVAASPMAGYPAHASGSM